jgi:hypothetical protein
VLEEVTFADLASGALPDELLPLLDDDGAWIRRAPPRG